MRIKQIECYSFNELSEKAKRKALENDKKKVEEIIIAGEEKAKIIAQNTMNEVHEKMKLG